MSHAFISNGSSLAKQVEMVIDSLSIPLSNNLEVIPKGQANVAVIQLAWKYYDSVEELVSELNELILEAINHRAHMICFPALTSWLALPLTSRFDRLFPELTKHFQTKRINPYVVSDMLEACSNEMMEIYMTTMAQLSRQHGIYIMAGSSIYYELHQAYHRGFLFDQFGTLSGIQDKVLPSMLEQIFKIEAAREIKVFDTPFGKLSMLLTTDVNTFEPARIASRLGAEMLICPDLFLGQHTPMDSADGLNLRVLENGIYGVLPTLVGDTGLGISLGKRSRVYAPPEITFSPNTDSVLYKARYRDRNQLLMAPLSFEALEEATKRNTDTNPEFYKNQKSYLF